MKNWLSRLKLSAAFAWVRSVGDFMFFTLKRFYTDDCFQVASALTYTSLLALVPLMTIGFAILSAFPAFNDLQQHAKVLLFNNLVPTVGEAVLSYLDRFSQNAGQLTGFGIIGLTVTSVMLLSTIEGSFNAIWKSREPRPLVIRLLAFWTILTLTPILFGVSLSLSGTMTNVLHALDRTPLAARFPDMLEYLPFLIEVVGFTTLYLIIPNRFISWRDALIGGVTGAIFFEISKRGFGWYLNEFPAYQTIYGAVALIPIFLLWVYIAWSTVLLGAVVTASLPEWRSGQITQSGPEGLLPSQRLVVAVAILAELYNASRLGVGMRRPTLLGRVPVGGAILDGMLEQLRQTHWLARTSRDAWVITRELADATLYDLQKSLGIGLKGQVRGISSIDAPWSEHLMAVLEAVEQTTHGGLSITLRDVIVNFGHSATTHPVQLSYEQH